MPFFQVEKSSGSVFRDLDSDAPEPPESAEYLSQPMAPVTAWMPFKRKSRSRPWKKTRRGTFTRRGNRQSFKARVTRVLMKKAETKYYDRALENHQLYHNLGSNIGGLVPVNVTSIPQFFNPWAFIGRGDQRSQRIGDKITPRGMALKLYLANKFDRPNTMIRLIVAVLPKLVNGVVTTAQFDPFQIANSGSNGNNMLFSADSNVGVKFLYDRIIRFNTAVAVPLAGGAGNNKENTKVIKLWIKRKRSRDIVYGDLALDIVNKPLAIYAIPYEQYSTFTTDNIASLAGYMRLYYKDV